MDGEDHLINISQFFDQKTDGVDLALDTSIPSVHLTVTSGRVVTDSPVI